MIERLAAGVSGCFWHQAWRFAILFSCSKVILIAQCLFICVDVCLEFSNPICCQLEWSRGDWLVSTKNNKAPILVAGLNLPPSDAFQSENGDPGAVLPVPWARLQNAGRLIIGPRVHMASLFLAAPPRRREWSFGSSRSKDEIASRLGCITMMC